MNNVLIHPNWHVLFIHLPLGLLVAGILIELFSFLWERSSVRAAGRWMILLGALSALPAATTGIYAFYDVVHHSGRASGETWQDLVKASSWGPQQWFYMRMHIWLMSCAVGLFLLAAITWVGSSDGTRAKFRWPILAALLVALGGAAVGAWFSGEAVYLLGVAAEPRMSGGSVATTNPWSMPIKVDPAQVHLLLIGLTLLVAAGAIGVTFRRWAQEPVLSEVPPEFPPPTVGSQRPAMEFDIQPPETDAISSSAAPLFPARFWLIAGILTLLAGVAGLWTTEGLTWWIPETQELFKKATSATGRTEMTAEQTRMLIHALLAIMIVLLSLILALVTRFGWRLKWITIIGMALLALAVGVQVWMGASLLYSL